MAKEVPYRLKFGKNADPNITALSATVAAKWEDVWKFRCPEGMMVLVKPGDVLSGYITSNTGNQIAAPDAQVQVEIRDASEEKREIVYGPENYTSITELQDKSKTAKLNGDHPVLVKPRDFIVIMGKDDQAMVSADIVTNSYGWLDTTKIV